MSDSDVDKFLADTNTEGTPKLTPWESQIFELLAKNASYEKIRKFLESQNVKVGRSQINYFVKAKKRAKLYSKAMEQRDSQTSNTEQETQAPSKTEAEPTKETKPGAISTDKEPDSKTGALPPKFIYDIDRPKPKW